MVAQVTNTVPEVTRLNVVGFNDPEMQRDILTGGGLGPSLAVGVRMSTESDGEGAVLTRRVYVQDAGVDFAALIGAVQAPVSNFVLTVAKAFPSGSLPLVRDLTVRSVVDAQTLDLNEQVLVYSATDLIWTLRQRSLTLAGIPGGILYPNTAEGTVVVPSDQIHIGGAADIYVRSSSLDSDSLLIQDLVDDAPALQGLYLTFSSMSPPMFTLTDLVLGVNYSVGDSTYTLLGEAVSNNLSIQVLDPPSAGAYRILEVVQVVNASPVLVVTPALPSLPPDTYRWRISASIFVDLLEPKETKLVGANLQTVQGSTTVTTASGVDFDDYGVGQGDILRISSGGLIEGDYVVQSISAPFYAHLTVDRALPATVSGVQYRIFRVNAKGGLTLPFVRISSIQLLDTSSQPMGTTIPYAAPIDIESGGFANSAHGIKADIDDGILGIVSLPFSGSPPAAAVNGLGLYFANYSTEYFPNMGVNFVGTNPIPLTALVSQINAAVSAATGGRIQRLAVTLSNDTRIGILPVVPDLRITFGTARYTLFGYPGVFTTRDIRSASVVESGGWASLKPALDLVFDVAQVLDGLQVGFYDGLTVIPNPVLTDFYDPLRLTGADARSFQPETGRHIQVGARSLGTARCYFLEPTSFEVDSSTVFTRASADGSVLRYLPDPTNDYQRIPALPSDARPLDGETGGSLGYRTFSSASIDFVAEGIREGDHLVLDYVPLTGAVPLVDPVLNLSTKTLLLRLGGGPAKTVTFIHDLGSIPVMAVTRSGVAAQVNAAVGQTICSINAANQLEFNPTTELVIGYAGTANIPLGFATDPNNESRNLSPNAGSYVIGPPTGDAHQITVQNAVGDMAQFPSYPTDVARQQFSVLRDGLQRVTATVLAQQETTAGLYYFDVQLVSQGTGDQYNINSGLQMQISGFRSDGYYLTTDDSNLSFSPVERPKLHISPSILEVGVSDAPSNALQLAGQNILINYARSTVTNNVDNFVRADTERVINASPLARHLIPYFVRFAFTYAGGSAESVLIPDIQAYIQGLYPTDALTVSALEKLAANRGATMVDNPINLIAVVHNVDRSITVERSQNGLNTGRLAAFIPDVLSVTRRIL